MKYVSLSNWLKKFGIPNIYCLNSIRSDQFKYSRIVTNGHSVMPDSVLLMIWNFEFRTNSFFDWNRPQSNFFFFFWGGGADSDFYLDSFKCLLVSHLEHLEVCSKVYHGQIKAHKSFSKNKWRVSVWFWF